MTNQANSEFYQLTKDLMIEIHKLTLQLSGIQLDTARERGKQPMSSIAGYDKDDRKKQYIDFFKYLVSMHTAQNESHLETLFATGKLTNENLHTALRHKTKNLYGMINGFMQLEQTHGEQA